MPLASIDIFEGRSSSEKQALLQAVHDAMVEALKIPEDDRTYRLREYHREEFWTPPGRSDKYTIIEISLSSRGARWTRSGACIGPSFETLALSERLRTTSSSFSTSRRWRIGASGAGFRQAK